MSSSPPARPGCPALVAEAELQRIRNSPFLKRLGLEASFAQDDEGGELAARVHLPYATENTNRGETIHGGVLASVATASGALASALTEQSENARVDITYLSLCFLRAVRHADVRARARVLGRGRDIAFVGVDLIGEGDDSELFCVAQAVYSFSDSTDTEASGRNSADLDPIEDRAVNLWKGGTVIVGSPFLEHTQMEISEDANQSAVLMRRSGNVGTDGELDCGAIAALADTCGALATYRQDGVGSDTRGATTNLAVTFLERPAGDVLAIADPIGQGGRMFSTTVKLRSVDTGRVCAEASMNYRVREGRS